MVKLFFMSVVVISLCIWIAPASLPERALVSRDMSQDSPFDVQQEDSVDFTPSTKRVSPGLRNGRLLVQSIECLLYECIPSEREGVARRADVM